MVYLQWDGRDAAWGSVREPRHALGSLSESFRSLAFRQFPICSFAFGTLAYIVFAWYPFMAAPAALDKCNPFVCAVGHALLLPYKVYHGFTYIANCSLHFVEIYFR